jgi:hypothetical protein
MNAQPNYPQGARVAPRVDETPRFTFRKASVTCAMRDGSRPAFNGFSFNVGPVRLIAHKTNEFSAFWQVTEPVTGKLVTSGQLSRQKAAEATARLAARVPDFAQRIADAIAAHNATEGETA